MEWGISLGRGSYPVNYRAYRMSRTEFVTLATIKDILNDNSYGDLFSLESHLQLLESIRKRLSIIVAAEAHSGMVNWSLKQQIEDINELVSKLQEARQKLFVS